MQNRKDITNENPMQTMIQVVRTRNNAVIPHGKRPKNTTKVKKNKYASTMNYNK